MVLPSGANRPRKIVCSWYVSTLNDTGTVEGAAPRPAANAAAARMAAAAAAATGFNHRDRARPAVATARAAEIDEPDSACSAKAMSLALWKRSAGDFSRQCDTIGPMAGGRPLEAASGISGGSSLRIAVMVSAVVSRWNARWPEINS